MENLTLKSEAIPKASEKDEADMMQDTKPENDNEIFVPVKYNKEIRNLGLNEAAELAQKGLKFEAIAADYVALKRIAQNSGKSVSDFLCALEE